jgi:uncharacterized 2Fe-2S/4Fe-4S cluster protein (DUF4445 family)
MTERHTVVFQPSGARGEVEDGTSIRRAAAHVGVDIESICADAATCGKCWVVIEDGDVARLHSSPAHASPMGPTEGAWLAERAWLKMGVDPGRVRLSCQATVHGDMVVFVPESSRGNRQIIRKAATARSVELRPAVRRYYLTLERPSLEDPRGDVDRLSEALVAAMARVHNAPEWRAPRPDELQLDLDVVRRVGDVLRLGEWKVSVTVWQERRVIDVRPGFCDELYGVALDVGSTAIAAYVCDLMTGEVVAAESIMNPQVTYGDDIVSRMKYELDVEDGLATLHDTLVSGVNAVIERALREGGIDRSDVHEVVVVGNTTMHHSLLGLSTRHLSTVPYAPVVNRALDVSAAEVGLVAGPGANVHVLPAAAGFVGADAMAVIVAEEPHRQDDNVLIIDVGTNAELIAGNRDGLVCTSTPTGPAFEGAHIEHGMRATVGAIERIEIDAETLEPRYQVIGTDGWGPNERGGGDADGNAGPVKGICGSAIIDGVAEMFRVGIITPRGGFTPGPKSDRIRMGNLGWEYVVARAEETSIGRDIPITLDDVRQIQLAKAALYTAARILLRELGIETPDRIVLAGAFGSRIDTTKAMVLGMVPDCPLDRVVSVGNAAGDGARIALLNRDKRLEVQEVARTIRRIELPTDPEFQNEYLQAMNFPHISHRFASVADLIGDRPPDPMAERFRSST